MIRLFCLLPDPVSSTKVKHYVIPAGGKYDQKQEMGPAQLLVIEAMSENPDAGALLYRFASNGECVGDTWHKSIEDAKKQVVYEYDGLAKTWQQIPAGVVINEFVASELETLLQTGSMPRRSGGS
jgi:hypothetical protein